MEIIYLALGTVLVILYFRMAVKGRQYEYLLEHLDEKEFPLKELYGIGFAWEYAVPALSYAGPLAQMIRQEVMIYYGDKFCEYYCRLILAQVYTYAHLCICAFALLAGFSDAFSGAILLIAGIGIGIALGDRYLKQVKEKMNQRAEACVEEFPTMVTKLALLIHSGMILREAWYEAANSAQGEMKKLMQFSCSKMENGCSDIEAIHAFGINSGSKEMKKFSNSLIQGMDRGNSELAYALTQQSSELWEAKRQHMLQKGEAAATKLLVPTMMMFAGLILVVISAAMNGLGI